MLRKTAPTDDTTSAPREPTGTSRRAPSEAGTALGLSADERGTLRALLANVRVNARHARRIRVVLLSGDGVRGIDIARRLALSVGQVSRIRQRFIQRGVAGLADSPHLGRRDHAVPEQTLALIATLAASPPPPGRKRWSTRLIAAEVGLSSATVAKVLRNARNQLVQKATVGAAKALEPFDLAVRAAGDSS